VARRDREPAQFVLQGFDGPRSTRHSRDQTISELEKTVVKALAYSSDREVGQLGKLVGQQIGHRRLTEKNFRIGPRHVTDDTDRSRSLKRSSRHSSRGFGARAARLR
jgi:hypothetical protein